jgi:hypothetical protein
VGAPVSLGPRRLPREKRHNSRLPSSTNRPGLSDYEAPWRKTRPIVRVRSTHENAANLSVDDVSREYNVNQAATDCLRRVRIAAPNPPKPTNIMDHVAGSGTAVVTVWTVAKKIEFVPAKE